MLGILVKEAVSRCVKCLNSASSQHPVVSAAADPGLRLLDTGPWKIFNPNGRLNPNAEPDLFILGEHWVYKKTRGFSNVNPLDICLDGCNVQAEVQVSWRITCWSCIRFGICSRNMSHMTRCLWKMFMTTNYNIILHTIIWIMPCNYMQLHNCIIMFEVVPKYMERIGKVNII